MIETNRVQCTLNWETIDRDFVLFKAEKDGDDYKKSLILDAAAQTCKALAVQYEWGNCCYFLYRREDADLYGLRRALEDYDCDGILTEVKAPELYKSTMAQLLFNAIPSLASGNRMYHNLTGGLYELRPEWIQPRKGELHTLRIQLTWDLCLTLHVKTFRKVKTGAKNPKGEPRYLMDSGSGMLRRVLKQDPDAKEPQYEQKVRDRSTRNNVAFLNFDTLEHFERSKMGVLESFLRDVEEVLGEYLTVKLTSVQENRYEIGNSDTQAKIVELLRQQRIFLEDTICDRTSGALQKELKEGLRRFYGVELQEGRPGPGDVLLRIVHKPEWYGENAEGDPYGVFPEGCVVQHLTLEKFMTEREEFPKDNKSDPYLQKIVQELAIKQDIQAGKLQFYGWNYSHTMTFVTATRCEKKSQHYIYDRLDITPDGKLHFDSWDNLKPPTDLAWNAIERVFQTKNGKKVDYHVKGVLYEELDSMRIIKDTDQFPVPNLKELKRRLSETRPEERLEIAPLCRILREQLEQCSSQKDRESCIQLLADLDPLGESAARKEVKKIVVLRSNLSRKVNDLYFEETGKWIGHRMKDAASLEKIFSGVLDIRHFWQNGKWCYYTGMPSQALKFSVARGCPIRQVTALGKPLDPERYLPLMAVDFVRTAGWTVLPFPFKYLREWRALQNPKMMASDEE